MPTEVIALVSCVKSKQGCACPAQDLYVSPLFRRMRAYAEQYADRWFILSAKHYLVSPGQILEPYEQTLTQMTTAERRDWASVVYTQMQKQGLLHAGASFLWLAGRAYKLPLASMLSSFEQKDPLEGLRLGLRLKWLNARLDRRDGWQSFRG